MNIGDKFGDWIILETFTENGRKVAKARCKCGIEKVQYALNYSKGNTTKCRSCSYAERGPLVSKRIKGDHLAAQDKFNDYKVKAKQRGIDWNINFEDFKIIAKKNCHYCDAPPSNINKLPKKEWADDFVYSGLDRKNNLEGYVIKNVVSCCWTCNYMKRDLTFEQFIEHINKILSVLTRPDPK